MILWPSFLSSLLIVLLPFLLAAVLRRRRSIPWLYFMAGVATFAGARIIQILINQALFWLGVIPGTSPEGNALIGTAIIFGLTAGLTQEIARFLGYRLLPGARSYSNGIMMGLGHGGLESMLLGILMAAGVGSLWNQGTFELLPQGIAIQEYASLQQQLNLAGETPLAALTPLIERLIYLSAQITLSVIVMTSVANRRWSYLLAAILYHTALTSLAIMGTGWFDSPWLVQLMLLLLVLPGAVWTWAKRPRSDPQFAPTDAKGQSSLALLMAVSRKELLFQWRTRRVLIIVAIFLVLGMISPLLAKFTPELIASLEEAAQFAELIPEPSIVDAVNQYFSNLTQFGFILVILLGMNAVAGEKEKGTAAMILSKPLPRWIFIVSKYLSQGVVYLIAVALSGLAAYYYTLFLFDSLPWPGFLLSNLLLYAWLMVYAAITLLGSALGKTTAAAAGIAAIGGITILLSSTIPHYGILAPSGLLEWASALSLDIEGGFSGGAIAAALGLILLALAASITAIEEQEL